MNALNESICTPSDTSTPEKNLEKAERTKDILYVMRILGHKSILSTERYTELEEYRPDEKYQSAVAMTLKDAQKLIEDGFTYVCDFEGHPLFRKIV